jgi:hypothetical protein
MDLSFDRFVMGTQIPPQVIVIGDEKFTEEVLVFNWVWAGN